MELKDKVKAFAPEAAYQSDAGSKDISKQEEEAVLALVQLGFKYETARKSVMKISSALSSEETNSENLIRKTLQSLNS